MVANELRNICCIETRTRTYSVNLLACLYPEPIKLICPIDLKVFY